MEHYEASLLINKANLVTASCKTQGQLDAAMNFKFLTYERLIILIGLHAANEAMACKIK